MLIKLSKSKILTKYTIDGVDDSEIVLQGTGVWNDASYVDSDYKISLLLLGKFLHNRG